MATYPVDQIVGKTLYSKVNLNIRKLPDINSTIIKTVKPNDFVGVVYSYISKSDGIWWILEGNSLYPNQYVKHQEGYFDLQNLRNQGAKTTEELLKEEEQKNKTFSDYWQEALKLASFGIGAFVLVKIFSNNK